MTVFFHGLTTVCSVSLSQKRSSKSGSLVPIVLAIRIVHTSTKSVVHFCFLQNPYYILTDLFLFWKNLIPVHCEVFEIMQKNKMPKSSINYNLYFVICTSIPHLNVIYTSRLLMDIYLPIYLSSKRHLSTYHPTIQMIGRQMSTYLSSKSKMFIQVSL